MHVTTPTSHRHALLLLIAVAAALSGCGERGMFAKGKFRETSEAQISSRLVAEEVTAQHYSTRCGKNTAARCEMSAASGVEVIVNGSSIVFDFANVQQSGVFEEADFEGFIVEVSGDTPILIARVDTESTNLDIGIERIAHDDRHLDVNFAGLAYDSASFVKIDLLVGPLNPLPGGR